MTVSADGTVEFTPDNEQVGTHTIVLSVTDGIYTDVQNYTLEVQNVNDDPIITSTPVTSVSIGQEYIYAVEASDPDNDVLNYDLIVAPSGMSVSTSGVITWPDDGSRQDNEEVTLEVIDGNGGSDSQTWNITITPDDTPPVVSIDFSANPVQPGQTVVITVNATDNVGVSDLGLSIDEIPVTLDENNSYTHTTGAEDTIPIFAWAEDNMGNEGTAEALLVVSSTADVTPPEITLEFTPANPVVGDQVIFTVTANDDIALDNERVWLKVDGVYRELDAGNQATYTAVKAGQIPAIATAYDISGNYGEATATVPVTISGTDPVPPVAEITSPEQDSTILGRIDVIGTATDDKFAYYTLSYRDVNDIEFIEYDRAYSPVSNNVLGKFDATTMENGDYLIRLTVFDQYGNWSRAEVTVHVDGQAKLGNFTLSFSDMSIVMNGIDIEIIRTYDSRNKTKVDFGVGWRLGVKSIKLNENHPAGEGWDVYDAGGVTYTYQGQSVYIPNYVADPEQDHTVSIPIPGARTQKFEAKVNFNSKFDNNYGYITMEPGPGTHTKLQILDDNQFFRVGNNLYSFDMMGYLNPNSYKLTLLDDSYFIFDQDKGGLIEMGDPNGNTIVFGHNGIEHSDGEDIVFNRDAEDRITSVIDPDSRTVLYSYDGHGNLQTVTDPKGNITRFKYGPDHYLNEIIDPRGIRATRTEYDDAGRMICQINANGDTLKFDHDIDARIETVTDFAGNQTQYIYDERGNVLTKTDAVDSTWTYTYDVQDNQLSETFPNGSGTSATYDSLGNKLTETDELDNTTTWTYNDLGKVTSKTDPLNRTTTFIYDDKGNMLREIGPDLTVITAKGYDEHGNIVSDTNALGHVTTYTHWRCLVASSTDALGRTTSWAYDNRGNVLLEIDPKENRTSFIYDANNNKLTETDALDNTTTYEYTSFNKISRQIDAKGNETLFEYNVFGQLKKTIMPDSSFTEQEYDINGNISRNIDPVGRTVDMEYDHENRLTKTILNDDSFTTMEYDSRGRRTASVDAKGNRTEYEYDDAGNNTIVRDALLNENEYEYDEVGNRIAMIDALGQRTEYEYDEYDRQIKITFHNGTFKTIEYDDAGRKISETDQEGNTTTFDYDEAGNLVSVTDALEHITSYTYDDNNNRISQTDANEHTTTMEYDELNRLTKRTYPNGDEERFGYDENGNMIYRVAGTSSAGDSTSFEFDSRNREVYRLYSNSGHTVQTIYTADSKRDTVIDHRGMTTYQWGNCCGQLVRVDNPDNTFIEYEYDDNKNKTAMITPWNRTEYIYGELNRMDSVIAPDGGVTEYFYNAVGNRDSLHHANGTSVVYEYDNLNRLTKVTNYAPDQSVISSYTYELNNAGIRTAVLEEDGSRVDYGYDDLYRLTSETRTGTNAYSIYYTYDQVGNRVSKNHDGAITNYEYNNRDQLLSETTPTQTITYTYDASGRTETKTDSSGITTYSWVDNDRMSSVASPTQTLFYEYDIDGIKVKLDNGTNVSYYLIDKQQPFAQVIAEYDISSSLTAEYVFGLERISQNRGGVKSTYIADGQGSIRQLSNNIGNVTDTYDYCAFGELLNRTGTTVNEFQYVGEQFDPNTNYYYLRARWYNPQIGRFASVDPFVGNPQTPISLHKYLYAGVSPLSYYDPSGEMLAALMVLNRIMEMYTTSMPTVTYSGYIDRCETDRFSLKFEFGFSFGLIGYGGFLTARINELSPTKGERRSDCLLVEAKYNIILLGLGAGISIDIISPSIRFTTRIKLRANRFSGTGSISSTEVSLAGVTLAETVILLPIGKRIYTNGLKFSFPTGDSKWSIAEYDVLAFWISAGERWY